MSTICLVACASKKRDGSHPAGSLYISDLFEKSAKYAQYIADDWYILSAKFGLLRPDKLIEKYDLTLNRMPIAERRQWAERVFQDLRTIVKPSDQIIILAGQRYAEHLIPRLSSLGVQVTRPLEGLRIGEQLRWLKEHRS